MAKRTRIKPAPGDKTIKFTIAFFTNAISKKRGYIVRRECWDEGTVYPHRNKSHGIVSEGNPKPFNSFGEILSALQKSLIAQRIRVRPGSRSAKFIASQR